MRQANGGGDHGKQVEVIREDEYRAFDKLPPVLRETLRYSQFKYSALEVSFALARGMPAGAIISLIRTKDEIMARRERAELEAGQA